MQLSPLCSLPPEDYVCYDAVQVYNIYSWHCYYSTIKQNSVISNCMVCITGKSGKKKWNALPVSTQNIKDRVTFRKAIERRMEAQSKAKMLTQLSDPYTLTPKAPMKVLQLILTFSSVYHKQCPALINFNLSVISGLKDTKSR